MKLSKKKMVLMSFMLFSLFFGAGNLIFPPFLGQNAGEKMPFAIAAFLITAVILPVLGVIVVAKFDGWLWLRIFPLEPPSLYLCCCTPWSFS